MSRMMLLIKVWSWCARGRSSSRMSCWTCPFHSDLWRETHMRNGSVLRCRRAAALMQRIVDTLLRESGIKRARERFNGSDSALCTSNAACRGMTTMLYKDCHAAVEEVSVVGRAAAARAVCTC
jgi:hypothetical protein